MARPNSKEGEKKVQKSIYLEEKTWKLIERHFGWGRASANIERILLIALSNPDEERRQALVELEAKVNFYNAFYGRRLELRAKEETPEPPEEKNATTQYGKIVDFQ